jgi:hypothetical protein
VSHEVWSGYWAAVVFRTWTFVFIDANYNFCCWSSLYWILLTHVEEETFYVFAKQKVRSSETSVHTRSTRRHIPEDGILHSYCRENLKSYITEIVCNKTYEHPPSLLCNRYVLIVVLVTRLKGLAKFRLPLITGTRSRDVFSLRSHRERGDGRGSFADKLNEWANHKARWLHTNFGQQGEGRGKPNILLRT